MRPQELAAKCAKAITDSTEHGLPNEDACILLVLPKGWKPPPRFPRGRTAQWKEDGTRVAYFNAMNVLAWLVASGDIEVRTITLKRKPETAT